MLSRIYRGQYGDDGSKNIDTQLLRATRDVFNTATATGIAKAMDKGTPAPSPNFLRMLDRNNAIFSAFRTHRMQQDVAALLLDSDGNIKPFNDFRRDVTPIIGKYNGAWLRTEYTTAVQRSRLAANWQQYIDEADVFPCLEWVPSTAIHPGEDHRLFWNTIRPIDDPFWSQHRPGDRWNCQCDIRQTDLPPTDIPTIPIGDAVNNPTPGLDNNPGNDGIIFNHHHPYFPNNCTTCPFAPISKKLIALAGIRKKDCSTCLLVQDAITEEVYKRKTYKSGGYVEYPTKGKQNKVEQRSNITVVEELAKYHSERYRLLPVSNEHGKKNPDAFNLKTQAFADIKCPLSTNGKNAIQAAIREASKQEVAEAIIYLTQDYPMQEIALGLKAALQGGRARTVKTIIIRFHNKEIKRYDTTKLRKIYKK